MKKQTVKNTILLVSNLLLVVLIFYALYEYCHDSIENIVTDVHKYYEENSFSYFTTLSNILSMIVSAVAVPYAVVSLIKREDSTPRWLYVLRYVSTVYIVMTFLVVNVLLVWIVAEPYELYEGKEIITHVVAPILMLLNFLLTGMKEIGLKTGVLCTVLPVSAYSLVYFFKVFVFGVWSDFYSVGFLYPYSIPIFVLIFAAFCVGISYLLIAIKKKSKK